MPDIVCRGLRTPFKEFLRHQNKSRRAKATLKRAVLDERLLYGMKLISARQSLDGHHFASVDKRSEIQAPTHGQAIHERRTAAAKTLAAALSPPEQTEITTQHIDKSFMRRNIG